MGSDNFERDLRDLNRRVGGTHSDRSVLTDSHPRLDLYRIARGRLPAEEFAALMLAKAEAALVELIDDVAAERADAAFGEWATAALDAGVERRAFPSKRIHEWRLLISLDRPAYRRVD